MANNQSGNPGNFAQDRDKASDAGRKGGQASQGGQQHGSMGDSRQHSQTDTDNRQRTSDADRKSGQNVQGGQGGGQQGGGQGGGQHGQGR